MTYLMASEQEAERLIAQERANRSLERLRLTGLTAGARVLDAGCGSGAVDDSILEIVGPDGSVVGMDAVKDHVEAAALRFAGQPNASFRVGTLPETGLPDGSFDYVWSQYVFEYLRDPLAALHELVRVTRPGGKVVVADIDGVGLGNWPQPAKVTEGLARFEAALSQTGFDLFVGRKLFSFYREAGLRDIRVHLHPFYLVGGRADERMVNDWKIRFATLRPLGIQAFEAPRAYDDFVEAYLRMLESPDTFKYAVVLTVEGVKP